MCVLLYVCRSTYDSITDSDDDDDGGGGDHFFSRLLGEVCWGIRAKRENNLTGLSSSTGAEDLQERRIALEKPATLDSTVWPPFLSPTVYGGRLFFFFFSKCPPSVYRMICVCLIYWIRSSRLHNVIFIYYFFLSLRCRVYINLYRFKKRDAPRFFSPAALVIIKEEYCHSVAHGKVKAPVFSLHF